MKKKALRKFLKYRLMGGHCELCGKVALLGLKFEDGLLCFKCIRIIMRNLAKRFDLSFLGMPKRTKVIRREYDGEPSEDKYMREFNNRKKGRLARFSKSEVAEMGVGARLIPTIKKKKKKVTSGFEWMKT